MFVTFGPLIAILELVLFAVVVIVTRHVSAGSLAAAAACPLFAIWAFWGNFGAWLVCTIAALTVIWAHRANISRLRAGTESTIGSKK